jgi:hypothetical protein
MLDHGARAAATGHFAQAARVDFGKARSRGKSVWYGLVSFGVWAAHFRIPK